MNIVRTFINKKTITLALIAVGTLGAIRYTLTPNQIDVICDQRFSAEIQTSIKKTVHENSVRWLGAQRLRALIEKEYPFVQDVTIEYRSSLRARVTVLPYVPQVVIVSSLPGAKEYLLMRPTRKDDTRGLVQIEKGCLSAEAVYGLPIIVIENNDFDATRNLPEFIECVREIKPVLFDEYTVTWRSKTEIVLQSNVDRIIIMADTATVNDAERLGYVKSIYKADHESYSDGMKADIRLRESVVCAPLTRK